DFQFFPSLEETTPPKQLYQQILTEGRRHKSFFEANFISATDSPTFGLIRNRTRDFIGHCYRGEIEEVKQYLKRFGFDSDGRAVGPVDPTLIPELIRSQTTTSMSEEITDPSPINLLNRKSCYVQWVNYNNYRTVHYHAGIAKSCVESDPHEESWDFI